MISALAFTAYFHFGSSLMSGSCSCSSGCSWSWTLELPPPPQSLPSTWHIPNLSSSSTAVEVENKKCFYVFMFTRVRALRLCFTAAAFTCVGAVLTPFLRYFLLLLVQVFPLLFGMTQAEDKAMELGAKMRHKSKKASHFRILTNPWLPKHLRVCRGWAAYSSWPPGSAPTCRRKGWFQSEGSGSHTLWKDSRMGKCNFRCRTRTPAPYDRGQLPARPSGPRRPPGGRSGWNRVMFSLICCSKKGGGGFRSEVPHGAVSPFHWPSW